MTTHQQAPADHPFAKGFSEGDIHREEAVELHLLRALVEKQGYRARTTDDFDRATALDTALVLEFDRTTQASEWSKLSGHYAASAEAEFLKQLEQGLSRPEGTGRLLGRPERGRGKPTPKPRSMASAKPSYRDGSTRPITKS